MNCWREFPIESATKSKASTGFVTTSQANHRARSSGSKLIFDLLRNHVNIVLAKTIAALIPASMLFAGSVVLCVRYKTPSALLQDRKSTRLNSSHTVISYAVFCLKKKM